MKNVIYRSADEGRTWEAQFAKMERPEDVADVGSGVISFHVSPANADVVFFRGSGKHHWASRDRGERYQLLSPSFTIKEIKMHPTQPQWLLASHLTDGCHSDPTYRVNCSLEVYVSTDLGGSWRLVAPFVAQFEWAPADDGVVKSGFTEETIFLVVYEQHHGNQPFGVWSARAIFERSDDLGRSRRALLPRGNRFLFLDKFLFVAVVNQHHENQASLTQLGPLLSDLSFGSFFRIFLSDLSFGSLLTSLFPVSLSRLSFPAGVTPMSSPNVTLSFSPRVHATHGDPAIPCSLYPCCPRITPRALPVHR